MKKRLLASLLSLVMLLGMLPISVLAVEGEATPVCVCEALCSEEQLNTDCPVCAEDSTNCAYTQEEEEPVVDTLTEAVQAFLTLAAALPELDDPAEGIAACGAAYDALTDEEKAREDVAAAYAAFLAVVAEYNEPMVIPEAAAVSEIYVSKDGSDETGVGSQDNPYASLAKAAAVVNDDKTGTEFVIYVMSDLTSEACARFYDHDVTIKSLGNTAATVTRGKDFARQADTARSWYNPALIEIGRTDLGEPVVSLRLENIVLDDAGRCEGELVENPGEEVKWVEDPDSDGKWVKYFTQADSDGQDIPNTAIVQDAMIATYSGTGCITLGAGAVLRNFGGMSAVRVADGELVMEAGSVIEDTTVTDRTKGSGGNGPAGAIWSQGGEITMEKGSVIQNVVGRAIYADGGVVEINGNISNITSDKDMWWKSEGVALHLRNRATGKLGENGSIKNVDGPAVQLYTNEMFTMDNGSLIDTVAGQAIHCPGDPAGLTSSQIYMNGEITGIYKDGNAININQGLVNCTIGPDGYIHHNQINNGAIYMQSHGGTLDIYGRINYNYDVNANTSAGGIYMAHNQGHTTVRMYEGAEIIGNATEKGGGMLVSMCTFTMNGGTISDNIAVKDVGGGLYVRNGGTFIMNGGTISDNYAAKQGGGIIFYAADYKGYVPRVELNGGKIEGNFMNATVQQNDNKTYSASGGVSNDLTISSSGYGYMNRYLSIDDDFNLDNKAVHFVTSKKDVTSDDYSIKYGNASSSSITALTAEATSKSWDSPLATFWTQRDDATTLTVGGLSPNEGLPVYALVLETGEDGNPADGAVYKIYATTIDSDGINFTIPNGYPNGCAVALVQPTEDFGSVVVSGPAKITEVDGAESYEVEYTITYTMSDTLKNMIDTVATVDSFALTLEPDAALTADVLTTDAETLTVKAVLPAEKFAAGKSLFTTGNVKMTVSDVGGEIYIPANVVETQMVALERRYEVTFDANGGTLADGTVTPVTVIEGQTVTQPADPTRNGYTFSGWHLNGAKYDFATPVTGDITLIADWNYIDSSDDDDDRTPSKPATNTKVKGLNVKDHIAYVAGYPDGTVRPEGDITRAEMAAIFVNLMTEEYLEEYYSVRNPYLDVAVDAWYNPFVSTMYEAGAIKDSEDYFRPNEPITRAELAVMAAQFATSKTAKASTFSDVSKNYWAADEIALVQKMGWISGYPDGTFRPDNNITRAEAMAIINHMLERSVEEEHMLDDMIKWIDNPSTEWYYEIVQEATNGHTYKRTSEKVGGNDYYYERWLKLLND